MHVDWETILGAAAGGALGAAIGGLPAFVLTGFLALVGVAVVLAGGQYDFLTNVTFGPVLGPHVTFCGGAAAAALAARRHPDKVESGRDIVTPLAGLSDPLVLLVGAAFGVFGYVSVQALKGWSVAVDNTDVIALTVGVSNVLVRVFFGRATRNPFGSLSAESRQRGRWRTGSASPWVDWQESWRESLSLGVISGLLAAWLATQAGVIEPGVSAKIVAFGYALSAIALLFLAFDRQVPVTHHMTLMGALAAVTFGNVLWGALFGVLAALLGEFFSRLLLVHGDTHIDPPAWAIAVVTTVILVSHQIIG